MEHGSDGRRRAEWSADSFPRQPVSARGYHQLATSLPTVRAERGVVPRDAGSCRGFSGEGTSEGRCSCNSACSPAPGAAASEAGRVAGCLYSPALAVPPLQLARGEQVHVPMCH